MLFGEKLDFLMKLTNATNSSLAQCVTLDPSYVSRLRSGKRSPGKNEGYIRSMARYFSKRCAEGYHRKALMDALGVGDVQGDLEERTFQWLADAGGVGIENIDHFIARIASRVPPKAPDQAGTAGIQVPDRETTILYGVDGKREAVILFLSQVLAGHEPVTLMLFSDEPTDWMTADPAFAARWASLMSEVLSRGNRIKIIHTVHRDLDEMLSAIGQWMPLYRTGLIAPYYCPKKRDGIFKRTLFIAPETVAVVSTSVGGMLGEAANFLLRGARAVQAIEQEFNHYLSLCRPLARIFTPTSRDAYLSMLAEFEKEPADALMITESLSLLTMPEAVAASILDRVGSLRFDFRGYHQRRIDLFRESLGTKSYTEIIHLPSLETVEREQVAVSLSDILSNGTVYYTAREFVLHLEQIIFLLKENGNFHVCLTPKKPDARYMMYARDQVGAIIAMTESPSVVLAINEENITSAFWDFLKDAAGGQVCADFRNMKTAKKLSDYVRQLRRRPFAQ